MTNDETIDALIAACVEQASVMLSCKHDVRTPSRSAGSYEHHNAPVEFCHECGVACFWGAPLPAERAMVSVPATALVAMRDEVIALRKVRDAAKAVADITSADNVARVSAMNLNEMIADSERRWHTLYAALNAAKPNAQQPTDAQ